MYVDALFRERFQGDKVRDHREREKANTGCVMEVATAIGNWWNQCLIHKTLVYKTLESLINVPQNCLSGG